MPISTDKRVFERVEGDLAVWYRPQRSNKEFCSTGKNISAAGIRITLLKKLDVGTILGIEIFKYNVNIKAICRGKIVWIWDYPEDTESKEFFEAGIQFIDRDLLQIGKLMSYLEGQQKEDTHG